MQQEPYIYSIYQVHNFSDQEDHGLPHSLAIPSEEMDPYNSVGFSSGTHLLAIISGTHPLAALNVTITLPFH